MLNRSLIVLCCLLILACMAPMETALAAQVLRLEHLAIDPSVILTDEEIAGIKAKYEGADMALDGLAVITDDIDALYASKGYIAKAIIPPQTVENGILTISLVEGRLGAIHLVDNQFTQDVFFTHRLNSRDGDLIHIASLEDDITYFNSTNDVSIRAELMPGEAFGTTDLALHVTEPDNNQFSLALDNAGRRDTGRYRTSFTWQNASLFGFRDALGLTLLYAPGGTEVGSLSYNFPLTRRGVRVGATYNVNSVGFHEGTYAPVGLEVQSDSTSLTWSYPVHADEAIKVLLSADWHYKESHTYLSKAKLTSSRTQSAVVGLTVETHTPTGTWTINQGVHGGRSRAPAFISGRYYKYTANVQRTINAPDGITWVYRGAMQYTLDKMLPPDEQFTLGGSTTVRGHKEGAVSGDRGYRLTVEYHRPIHERIRANVFVDHGGVYPFKGNEEPQSEEEYVTSAGLGAEIHLFKSTTMQLHYGLPIGKGAPSGHVQFRMQTVF